MKETFKKSLRIIGKIFKWILIVLVIIFVLIFAIWKIPAVHEYAVNRATSFFNDKTGGKLSVGDVDLRLPFYIGLEDIGLTTPEGNQMAHIDQLEIYPGWRMLFNKTIRVDEFNLNDTEAKIFLNKKGEWNFDFIIEGFSDTTSQSSPTDTSSGGWDFSLGDVNINQFDFVYADRTSGDSVDVNLGKLELDMEELDLEKNRYMVEELALQNNDIYLRFAISAESTESEESAPLPQLGLETLEIENTELTMFLGDELPYRFDVGRLLAQSENIDLNQNKYHIEEFGLYQTVIEIPLPQEQSSETSSVEKEETSIFAPIDASLDEVDFRGVRLAAYNEEDTLHSLRKVNIEAVDLRANKEEYALELNRFSMDYNEFEDLRELKGSFKLTSTESSVQDFLLEYGQSTIDLNANISYGNFNDLIEEFKFGEIDLTLNEAFIARSDIRKAYRRLNLDTLPLPRDDIQVSMNANGDFKDINLLSFRLQSGGTNLNLSAFSQGDSIWPRSVNLSDLKLDVYRPDLEPFAEYLGVDTAMIPRSTVVSLSGNYLARSMKADMEVLTNFGNLYLKASGNGYEMDRQNLELDLSSPALEIGRYLGMSETLRTDLQFSAEGENVMSDSRKICSTLLIDTLRYADYGYNDLKLNADLFGDEIIYNFSVADTFANAVLAGRLEYGDSLEAVVSGSINGVDLQGLNFAEKDIRGGMDIYGYYRQDSVITDAFVQLADILFVKEGDRYPLSPVAASFYDCPDSTAAHLKSGFVELNSVANRSFSKIGELITNSLSREENEALADTGAYWNADLEVKNTDDIQELFLPQLKEFKPSTADLEFSAKNNELAANAVFPGIRYGNFILDSLSLNTKSIEGNVERNLHIDRLAYDSLGLTELDVNLDRTPEGAEFNLTINPDTSKNHYRVAANLNADSTRLTEGFNIHFNDSLILNGEKWSYNEACCIRSNQAGLSFEYFEFFRKNSTFRLDKAGDTEPTVFSAENFPIETVTGMVDTEQSLLTGEVNGELTLNQDGSFTGNGNITDFGVSGAPFGKLTWDASKEGGTFRTNIRNQGDLVAFTLNGNITPETDTTSTLDLDLNLEKFDLSALEEIMAEQIGESSGVLSGTMAIDGSSSDTQFEGELSFSNAAIKPDGSQAKYFIDGQSLKITPKTIDLNGFTIRDENQSQLRLGGEIKHDNFTKPRLDVTVKAEDFMLVDLKDGAGLGLYGKLVADLDLSITGKIAAPRVKADIRINKPTDFSYLVSESADREAFDETLLVWKNFEEEPENSILTRTKKQEGSGGNIFANNPKITGNLNIDKSAIFRVVIDSSAGDYLQIQGSAKLAIDYDRTGALRFNGIYEVSEGFYQMTFYDIVKRKFEFKEGSQIIWNGEPTNANIDITAVYRTRAGIANLMLIDPSASYDQSFQQQLPFLVLMDIQGELMDPEIFFDIQLAEGSEGALSGSVQARLRDLTENENRLNKQVFALLVLGSFLPQSGASDANILSNQARNSASQILTNQLNTLSDKYIKGVDINFDLYSYGGAAGQGNTDLNINLAKSFADDRVIVKVGSTIALEEQNSTAAQATQQQFLTNIEVEYKLTPDGRYRLIVFSKTDLEDIVIGRITRSGGGFVFQRDFDRFRHLFDPPKDEEEESLFEEENTNDGEGNSKGEEE